ncbi:hypothetical protein [Amnibacterium endophyticum]|uniref:Uncharacterized protein n=1 Tax=Amnibacterium endophyticum TaxID=2109337 RepID=A0ABW4LDT6_9MICO
MGDDAKDTAWVEVQGALLDDADADVTATDDALLVHGTPFAVRDGDDMVVDLPEDRADDLVERGVAARRDRPEAKGSWVSVEDSADWVELASEAHAFVGEPSVGRDS